ncbi:Mur ligase family protein [Nesterenkonia marinintestina]|uniref:Mur ligase family protein n=1 Tax=Nesterenkonia marinintestina TaxID=2979865 RepID=UPI0021C2167F|nr:UDP-N-acetylmuramoyl-tripeptide--D-alanyl-D-alanine ligase [Nesterenkonia sp. GX14115]
MDVQTLLAELPASVEVEYRGDETVDFGGMVAIPRSKERLGRFVILVDRRWGKVNMGRFVGRDLDASERIARASGSGSPGFLCTPETAEAQAEALRGANLFIAEDTLGLALRIAEVIRDRRGDRRITAVTGSAGKSTTKAMITHALKAVGPQWTVASPPNPQNVGVHVAAHQARSDRYDHSVIEVAGGTFISLRRHDFVLAADVAVLTSISEAHLNYLKSLEGVARQKRHIFDGLPASGVGAAVVCRDAPHSDMLIDYARAQGRTVTTYGEADDADIRLVGYDPTDGTVRAAVDGEPFDYRIGAEGRHMALNSLAVIAVLRAHGISTWEEGAASLESFSALWGRGMVSEVTLPGERRVTVIDEAYNANPLSMVASLEALAARSPERAGRRIAVLGDIRELGRGTNAIHRRMADDVDGLDLDVLHLFGPRMRRLAEGLGEREATTHWTDRAELTDHLLSELRDGDVILVKGSQATGLHALVSALLDAAQG